MLIGLHGKKQAGKDTVCERLGEVIQGGIMVERVSFADLLYKSAAEALGVTVAELQDWKTDARFTVSVLAPNGRPVRELTIREYLQRYGTEAHRELFDSNFWVKNVDLRHDRKVVVVTDVRFENEAQAIIDAGGTVVHVVGPPEVENDADGHASEKTLPTWMVDYALSNAVRDDDFAALDGRLLDLVLQLLKEGRRCA